MTSDWVLLLISITGLESDTESNGPEFLSFSFEQNINSGGSHMSSTGHIERRNKKQAREMHEKNRRPCRARQRLHN